MSLPKRTTRYMKASPATALGLLTRCFESADAEDAFENDSYAALKMLFDRKGLREGLGIQGSKITKLQK